MNYYLSLRVCEGLAVGALWQAWSSGPYRTRGRSAILAISTLVGCLTIVPGILFMAVYAENGQMEVAFRASLTESSPLLGFQLILR